MRIAQVGPLIESVPPQLYGGTERVVSYLTEELVAQGYDVTLFASGDSITSARLLSVCDRALRLDPFCRDALPYQILLLEQVLRHADEFDIIHFHTDLIHYPVFSRHTTPTVTTLHGRLDLPDILPLYRKFKEIPLVSISDAQRQPMPWLNWQATVYHGLPPSLLSFSPIAGKYLAFIGRICPEKRPDQAIAIARQSGLPLKIAAKVDDADRDYYETVIRPLLNASHNVEYIGEITEAEKSAFLGEASAVLLPIDWPEPFGLTMIEAMACGTPTIAYRAGSVPEVIDDGVTGFIVDNVDAAVRAIEHAVSLDRRAVRDRFERRFTADRMAHDYVDVYNTLLKRKPIIEQVA